MSTVVGKQDILGCMNPGSGNIGQARDPVILAFLLILASTWRKLLQITSFTNDHTTIYILHSLIFMWDSLFAWKVESILDAVV